MLKVNIKSTNLVLTTGLKKFIRTKIKTLEKFFDNIQVEAWVEIGKPSLHHQKGNVFYAECQINLSKKVLRATSQGENLKTAILQVREELERQIKKYKEKRKTKVEVGGRRLKEDLKASEITKKS